LSSNALALNNAVPYKANDTDINDIKMIGIFNLLAEGETLEAGDHYGLSINSPVHPATVPRFKTMDELNLRLSQAVTSFTGIETTITAIYKPATGDDYGAFTFGVQFLYAVELGVSFSSSISLGDFSVMSVEESNLAIGGSILLSNEFGVILGSDDTQGLKIVSEVSETNCTASNTNLNFDIILSRDDEPPVAHNITISSCAEGAAARVETVKSSVTSVVSQEDITVSLVGTTSLVLAFNPYWSKVEVYVLEENIYGLVNDTQKKTGFHFANGATELQVDLDVSGGATVSATLLDTIEVDASIDAWISGSLQFNSGSNGQLVPLDTWFSNMKSLLDASDEFHNPDFATCAIAMDGMFNALVEVRDPFALDGGPVTFEGAFRSPFELNLLDPLEVSSKQPNIDIDINLSNIGDVKNLSFGEVVNVLKLALEFLVGDADEGHTVDSCSGGLLGREIFGRNVFTYKIPILGVSACDFAGYLQIVVYTIDQLVNDCSECNDPNSPKSTFSALETKLNALLQDSVGGTPTVVFSPASDDIRSSLHVDITLQWSFLEASQLNIDLASILEGLDLPEDIKNFAKGLVAFDGGGRSEIEGSISFSLGIGLEYMKKTGATFPYIRGVTGLTLNFSADTNTEFEASIGHLSGNVECHATVDNYGEPLSITVGLDPSFNYYISTEKMSNRVGFQRVASIEALVDQIAVSYRGQILAEIRVELMYALGNAIMTIHINDINNVIQRRPGAVTVYYDVSVAKFPSFLEILLMEPAAIINSVDNIFKLVNDMTLGRQGIVTNLPMPFIGTAIARSLNAGSSDNFLEKSRRAVKFTLTEILDTYDEGDVVTELIANALTDILGNRLGILNGDVTVMYYEHHGETLIGYDSYSDDLDILSIQWEIPFFQNFTIELPPINNMIPLQISTGTAEPLLNVECSFKMAFGFNEDGFFLYTYRE
jgi:hypothetical protein